MTQLIEEAIEMLRELPEDRQDAAADALFAYISSDERQDRLRRSPPRLDPAFAGINSNGTQSSYEEAGFPLARE